MPPGGRARRCSATRSMWRLSSISSARSTFRACRYSSLSFGKRTPFFFANSLAGFSCRCALMVILQWVLHSIEKRRLLERREVTAAIELVPIDEVRKDALGPTAGCAKDFVGKNTAPDGKIDDACDPAF